MSTDRKFQVNLQGVIDLLSDNLYSGPEVFLRELLQNSVDAIVARRNKEADQSGMVLLEVLPGGSSHPPTIVVQDDGIGLTEAEVHEFLATIGQSSKRGALNRGDYIGQFGIGLLSGFVVSDEIVVVTRSTTQGSPTIEWRGRLDGTYTIRTIEVDATPGTQVYLRSKPGKEEFFSAEFVRDTASRFGSLLPMSITVLAGKQSWKINETPPWEGVNFSSKLEKQRLLDYGRSLFDIEFLDAIKLSSNAGGVEGIAFLLPHAAVMTNRQGHRVYLKHMLLSETANNVLPEWAFFVKCVVNATKLRPNAARESFFEDSRLAATREELGYCLKAYLIQLSREDRARLDTIIACHYLSIKTLALEDDEFFRLFIDWLPFETTLGDMTLGEYRQREKDCIQYVSSRDQFRQIAGVAAAQQICVINGGYTHDAELIEKLPSTFPRCRVKKVDVSELSQSFDDLTLDEREATFDFLNFADIVLQPYRCSASLRKFEPIELPTLYTANEAASFLRDVEQSQEVSNELWRSVLDGVSQGRVGGAYAELCLNYRNGLIRRLTEIKDKNLIRRGVEMLYVQALLLGHYPLKAKEMKALSEGLLGMIELSLSAGKS